MRPRGSSSVTKTCAVLGAVYLLLWCGAAWRVGQRGPAGLDLERRGSEALAALSLLDVSAALVALPLLVIGGAARSARSTVLAIFVLTSAGIWTIDALSTRVDGAVVYATRLLLASIAAMTVGAARLAAAVWRDVYDAAGAVLTAVAAVTGAVVFAAPALTRLGDADTLIAGLLAANPLVAMAGAAGFDLLRTDLLYRITPVAQRFFEYPSWGFTALLYSIIALICWSAAAIVHSREARCV